jgi:hypothetical protein
MRSYRTTSRPPGCHGAVGTNKHPRNVPAPTANATQERGDGKSSRNQHGAHGGPELPSPDRAE